jgi:hypothetical protein
MKRETIALFITTVLALLFFYAAFIKLINYHESRQQMLNQVFSKAVALLLTWLVPVAELIIMGLLLIRQTRLKGLYASALLLLAFTIYIIVAMSGVFGHIPCSCGGVLENMSYQNHIWFNLFFMVLAVSGIALETPWIINRVTNFLIRKEAHRL